MVVSSAAFGQKLTWLEDTEKPEPGFDVSFHKAILMVSQHLVRRWLSYGLVIFLRLLELNTYRIVTPSWADNWTKTNRDMVFGFSELKVRFGVVYQATVTTFV